MGRIRRVGKAQRAHRTRARWSVSSKDERRLDSRRAPGWGPRRDKGYPENGDHGQHRGVQQPNRQQHTGHREKVTKCNDAQREAEKHEKQAQSQAIREEPAHYLPGPCTNRQPRAVRAGVVWGIFKDELDVESVRGYEIVR